METLETKPLRWITVKSTHPAVYPIVSERSPIQTRRLILRSFTENDGEQLYKLRCQHDVMKWTGQGRPDADVAETKEFLKKMTSPLGDEIYVLAITMADTGEIIGTVGSHKRLGEFGWPVLGYMIRQEFWGKGIATEIVDAFLKLWWSLPREETEIDIRVEESTATPGAVDGTSVPECLIAITDVKNGASQAILKKFGFKLIKQWYWVDDDGKVSETDLSRSFMLVKPE